MEIYNEDIIAGRNDQNWGGTADFKFDFNDQKLTLRKIQIADIGDPPDVEFRMAGPDGASYQHFPPTEPAFNKNLGTLRWVPYLGVLKGWGVGAAQVYARYMGNNAGSLHLATNPEFGGEPVDRVIIEADGTLNLTGVPIINNHIKIRTPDDRIGYLEVKRNPS